MARSERVINSLFDILFKRRKGEEEWKYQEELIRKKIEETKIRQMPLDLVDEVELRYYRKLLDQIKKLFGIESFVDMSIAEYGSGTGILSLYMAREGANVVLLDTSSACLSYSAILYKAMARTDKFKGTATMVQQDFLKYKLSKKPDFIHSIGIIEHFNDGKAQEIINKITADVADAGYVLIGVPNFLSPDLMHIWLKSRKGSEKYYSKGKLKHMMEKSGLSDIKVETSTFMYPSFMPRFFVKRTDSLESLLGSRFGLGFLIMATGRKFTNHDGNFQEN